MKKGIMFILLAFLLIGCTANKPSNLNNIDKENDTPVVEPEPIERKQQYSFGPIADLSRIDDSTKEHLQSYLDKLGDPIKDIITFNGISTFYDDDGYLYVDLFIRNGCSYSVFNINATLDIIEDGHVIASAPFVFTVRDFGELESNMSRPWTILYYPEDVKNINAKLTKVEIQVRDLQYEY